MNGRIEIKQEFEEMERVMQGALYEYIRMGMLLGTISLLERRQAGLVAKNTIFKKYEETGSAWLLTEVEIRSCVYTENLIRIVMSSLLPQAQALACIRGDFWNVDMKTLKKACLHAGKYHIFLYERVKKVWALRECPAPWTTKNVRQYRKKSLKAYKANQTIETARAVTVSLLSPTEAQILSRSNMELSKAQISLATQRCPSPTYARAVEYYSYALESLKGTA